MRVIFYDEINVEGWYLFFAATEKGLCYVSAQAGSKENVSTWIQQQNLQGRLIENEERLKPYTTQLKEYIYGERNQFQLPLDLHGTVFQQSVWDVLREIPYGETRTYSEVAQMIGKPKAVRAVASAIGKNYVLIVIPCHRVIRKDGGLSGFREGVSMKKELLSLEGIQY